LKRLKVELDLHMSTGAFYKDIAEGSTYQGLITLFYDERTHKAKTPPGDGE